MPHARLARPTLGFLIGIYALSQPALAEDAREPVQQSDLNALVADGQTLDAFLRAFEAGDELSEHDFTAEEGVGANIGEGRIFTRIPRADLTGEGEWATHFPTREGGANSTSCISCHNAPMDNGAGGISANVVVDPAHTGDPALFLERNTTPLFALSIPQRLAEEMSLALYEQRETTRNMACETGLGVQPLSAKGVDFGTLVAFRTQIEPCVVTMDTTAVTGVDADLVIRPFGWKGNEATLRGFTRGAAHNELGLQGTETVGALDGDYDGVTHELSVGDLTALTMYMAGLERPVEMTELDEIGLVELADTDRGAITAGKTAFNGIGCASCHIPQMTLDEPIFTEPSRVPGYFDVQFPDGSDPAASGFQQDLAVSFDMRSDQPNNMVTLEDGAVYHLGAMAVDDAGRGVANWYTDLKRHDMGADLSDPADPSGIGAAMFLTRSLAGVGSTGPWLHDGRATTLDAAILAHGGEAAASSDTYAALPDQQQAQIVAFLENLVIYVPDNH